jgi:hypothetical protein
VTINKCISLCGDVYGRCGAQLKIARWAILARSQPAAGVSWPASEAWETCDKAKLPIGVRGVFLPACLSKLASAAAGRATFYSFLFKISKVFMSASQLGKQKVTTNKSRLFNLT